MRISLRIPTALPYRFSPEAARLLVSKPTLLTLPDGERVLATIVSAESADDGLALNVTLDFDPPNPCPEAPRSQSQSQPTSGNSRVVTSQVATPSQPMSQPMSQPNRPASQPPPAIFRSAEATCQTTTRSQTAPYRRGMSR